LQYDVRDGESESLASASGASVWTWREALSDLDETAALVCALDHVVTVCNALVHLSGALGQDATVLVPRAPEWRYGANGERMPWYPGITLVRQAHGEDWGPALRVAAARVAALS
jgi:hypothetical protein